MANTKWRLEINKQAAVVYHMKDAIFDVVVTPLHTHDEKMILYEKAGGAVEKLNRSRADRQELGKLKKVIDQMGKNPHTYVRLVDQMSKALGEAVEYFNRNGHDPECSRIGYQVRSSLERFLELTTKDAAVSPSEPEVDPPSEKNTASKPSWLG